ncbi:MAG: class I SAM-dependent methyltransferase [Candidatus Tectimicrobiota bacterium]
MHGNTAQKRLWAWHLSALVYEWAYVRVAHQVDEDLLAYLGTRLGGAVAADCGCGPGVVTAKLLQAGAARVVAIDVNASMVERAARRLAAYIARGQVVLRHMSCETGALPALRREVLAGRGFDLVLFKRSLYMPRPRALATLRQAAGAMQSGGLLIVVHPERSLLRYAFAPRVGLTSYTPLHVVNRALSRLLEWCGAEEYTLYTGDELLTLLQEAIPDGHVERVPSQQRPYNLVALQIP